MSQTSAGGIKDDEESVDCKGAEIGTGSHLCLSVSIYIYIYIYYRKSTCTALIPQREKINGFSPFKWFTRENTLDSCRLAIGRDLTDAEATKGNQERQTAGIMITARARHSRKCAVTTPTINRGGNSNRNMGP